MRSVAKTVLRQSADGRILIDASARYAILRHLARERRRRMLCEPAAKSRKCGIPTSGRGGGIRTHGLFVPKS